MLRLLRTWPAAAFAAAFAGITIGPQLPQELVLVALPVLILGFVIGYASALRETARGASQ
jgi:p-aminobenzoyl-glutamate transporter AbgT